MKAHWTIRVRLTVLYSGLFLLAGILLLAVTYVLVGQRLDRQTSAASVYGTQRAALLNQAPPIDTHLITLVDGRRITLGQLIDQVRADQRKYRDDMMNSLLTQGAVALAGVGVIAGALGWMLAGRALRPVHRITETARRIAGADGAGRGLHERIALDGPPDEVKELGDTFDLMLERLDSSFDGQRRFIASASHEMRTPLAINRALIEVSITRPTASADTRELGESLLKINARHERLIDGMLTLADSENEILERHPVDLADVAANVLAETADAADRAGVRIRPPELSAAPTSGDPYLLERVVQNLVENAIRHNLPHDGWLSVRTWSADRQAKLEVTNTGPTVRRYETEALFQAFRRLNGRRPAPRTDGERGFGLGLSIVRAVTGAHGGETYAEPHDGGGLIVTVTLPSSSEPRVAAEKNT